MSIIHNIKLAIKANLDALVVSEVLKGCTITDIKKNPLSADHPKYPWAYLMPPSVEGAILDNRSITRTYTFDILVMVNALNLKESTEIEIMQEAMLDKFDNDPTLQGTARGGIMPVASSPQPYQHNGKDLIMFVLQIQAKADVPLTFPG